MVSKADLAKEKDYLKTIKDFCDKNSIPYPDCLNDFLDVIRNHTDHSISVFYKNNPIYFSNDFYSYFGYTQTSPDPSELMSNAHCFEISPFSDENPEWLKKTLKKYIKKNSYYPENLDECDFLAIEEYERELEHISFKVKGRKYFLFDDRYNRLKSIISNEKLFIHVKDVKDVISSLFDCTASHNYISKSLEQIYSNQDKQKYLINELELIQLFFDCYQCAKENDQKSFLSNLFLFIEKWAVADNFLKQRLDLSFEDIVKSLSTYIQDYENRQKEIDKDNEIKGLQLIYNFCKENSHDYFYLDKDFYDDNYSILRHLFGYKRQFLKEYQRIFDELCKWEKCDSNKITVNSKSYPNVFKKFIEIHFDS